MSKRRQMQRCIPVEFPIELPEERPFAERPPREVPMHAEDLAELQAVIEPFPKTISPRVLTPTLVQEIKNKYYKNFTIPVGAGAPGFTNLAIKLRDLGIVADEITIITFPAGKTDLSYIMNDTANDATPIITPGQKEDQFEIEELYINDGGAAPAGNLIIRVVWNPYLIRLTP